MRNEPLPRALKIALALTVMASGRAMTLAFITRAGDGGAGDPPAAWLMPLLGDATIGLAAVVVAVLLWRRASLAVWTGAMIWTALGAFDALAAYVVERQSPWPEFFMLELVGRPMFFAAAAMHVAIGYLLTRPDVLSHFGMADGEDVASSLVSTRERASR